MADDTDLIPVKDHNTRNVPRTAAAAHNEDGGMYYNDRF